MQCPVCEYPEARLRYQLRDRFFGVTREQFPLFDCSSCGLLFLPEEGVEKRLSGFYPPGYWWREDGPGARIERWYREWMVRHDQLRWIRSCVDPVEGCRLLDIGCGAGTLVKLAQEAGLDAFGLEQAAEAVEIARQNSPGRIYRLDHRELISQGERFDIVTLFHALEHLPRPFRFLKSLKKLLSPGGRLFLQVPNRWSWQARLFGSRWYGLDCPRHLYNYSEFALLHLLGKAGYRIQKIRHYSPRDNAAAMVSSLLPALDPMSRKVRQRRSPGSGSAWIQQGASALYFVLTLAAQPLAWTEASLGRGGTLSVFATPE